MHKMGYFHEQKEDGYTVLYTAEIDGATYPVKVAQRGVHNLGGRRLDFWFAIPGDPFLWWAWHTGDMNTVIHAKRTKRLASTLYGRSGRTIVYQTDRYIRRYGRVVPPIGAPMY